MEENKGLFKKKNNGNIRSNESAIGLYSGLINQAKLNGIKNKPKIAFNDLSKERRNDWKNIIEEDYPLSSFPSTKEAEQFRLNFYNVFADQIRFTRLHRIILNVLEEMYNQQSIDNIWNWKKGNNGDEYDKQGCIYTNPTQLAKYIWGIAHPEYVKKVIGVLNDLSSKNVYLSRIEKRKDKEIYTVKKVMLIITCSIDYIHLKNGKDKKIYSYIQLHPVFFEGISKKYFRHRNNFYSRIRDYYYQFRKDTKNKQEFMLPPEEPFNMLYYFSNFTVQKTYKLTIDEDTLAIELNIRDFKQEHKARGRKKITTALDALRNSGVVLQWRSTIGKKSQQQYFIELNPDFFGDKQKQ